MSKTLLNEYRARLEFWWAKKTIRDGRDFEMILTDWQPQVRILRGKFTGIIFTFNDINVSEDFDSSGLIDFQTRVVHNPNNADITSKSFIKLTTNIFRIIITQTFATLSECLLDEEKVTDNANRNVDTGESTQEREFHEESTPLLEKRVSKRKPRKKAVSANTEPHSEVQQPAKPKRNRARATGKKGSNRK